MQGMTCFAAAEITSLFACEDLRCAILNARTVRARALDNASLLSSINHRGTPFSMNFKGYGREWRLACGDTLTLLHCMGLLRLPLGDSLHAHIVGYHRWLTMNLVTQMLFTAD